MSAAELTREIERAKQGLNPCKCGSRVVLSYSPGVTTIHCIREAKTVLALPDWAPGKLKEMWNSAN